jgi:hypothetical protein
MAELASTQSSARRTPHEVGILWTLERRGHRVQATIGVFNGYAWELTLSWNGQAFESCAFLDRASLLVATRERRLAFEGRGWKPRRRLTGPVRPLSAS